MIGQILPNNNETCYSNFSPTFREVNTPEAGNFLGGLCPGVGVVEAVACREGMALAQDLSLHRIRVASDCVNAVRSIRGDGLGPCGPIVREIKPGNLVSSMLSLFMRVGAPMWTLID
jgi:hypothetical protein